jgi:hypothetical protein
MKSFESAFLLSVLGAFGAGGTVFGQASTQGLGAVTPPSVAPRPRGAAASAASQGNPLWAIPLASLHETRDQYGPI